MASSSLALMVACVATLAAAESVPYTGAECQGLVEFDLLNYTHTSTLDGQVHTRLQSFPVYISYACKSALRSYYCLSTYLPWASPPASMCVGVCQHVLTTCGSLLEKAAKASDVGKSTYALFEECADPNTNPYAYVPCVNTSSSSTYFPQDEPSCFYGTVVPDRHGASFLLQPSACALPCPGGVFYKEYGFWHELLLILTVISTVGACASTYSFATRYVRQRKERSSHASGINSLRTTSLFPVLMFCTGGLIQSLVNCIAHIVELSHPKCEGNAKFSQVDSMCYIQSVTILGCGWWSSVWSVVMAWEAFAMAYMPHNPSRQRRLRVWYLPVAVVSTITSMVAVHVHNSQVLSFPFCAPSFNHKSNIPYIDAFYAVPGAALVSASSLMLFAVMFKLRRVSLQSRPSAVAIACTTTEPQRRGCLASCKMLNVHLLRIFLLVLCYNCFIFFSTSLLFNQQLNNSKYKTNAAHYYACLFTNSISSPEIGRQHCGGISDWNVSSPYWVYSVYVGMIGLFGLIPFLIFGLSYKCLSRPSVLWLCLYTRTMSGWSSSKKPEQQLRDQPPVGQNQRPGMDMPKQEGAPVSVTVSVPVSVPVPVPVLPAAPAC